LLKHCFRAAKMFKIMRNFKWIYNRFPPAFKQQQFPTPSTPSDVTHTNTISWIIAVKQETHKFYITFFIQINPSLVFNKTQFLLIQNIHKHQITVHIRITRNSG
jgi:hypothetical protein